MAVRKFKEAITNQIMKQTISESREDTDNNPMELQKEMQNVNAQHRKEWETIKKF